MKNKLALLIGIVLGLLLLATMITYEVRYDEVAVLTTFDKAEAPVIENGQVVDPGSLIREPGLRFKAPWPIQKVYTYSTKLHLLDHNLEQLQTADGYSLVVRTYLVWRIEDPYAFFRTVEYVAEAEEQLAAYLSNMKGVIAAYNFADLVNTESGAMRLGEIERQMEQELRQQLSKVGYGIAVEQVGIRRIVLPEDTTEKVFQRMRTTRERLAERALAEGDAQAATIRSQARNAQQVILAFAEQRAQAIRDEGNREAVKYFEPFQSEEQFAIFLRQIEALKQMLSHNTTFILDANNLSVLELLKDGVQPPPQTATDTDVDVRAPEPAASIR